MNNQALSSRSMEKSTRSCGRRHGPYGYASNALGKIWFALAVGFLLIPGIARAQQYLLENEAFPGDTFTQLLSINDADVIAGYHGQMVNQGFILNLGAPNVFTPENFPGSMQTQVTGINNSGDTSGFYIDNNDVQHGFLETNGVFSTVDFPGTTFNNLLGLNNTGQSAGFFMTGGQQTQYIFNPFLPVGGQFKPLTLPGSGQATDINDKGQVSGFFATGQNADDGFLLSAGKLTILSFPGATVTEALGLNNLGQVVGFYNDAAGNPHGFIYSGGLFTTIDDPGATQTTVNGINNFGIVVGFALEQNGDTVGFVGAPVTVPEPSLFSLLALGSTALVGMCILRSRRSLR
jgi:probable HAF family extracellular repeat protein